MDNDYKPFDDQPASPAPQDTPMSHDKPVLLPAPDVESSLPSPDVESSLPPTASPDPVTPPAPQPPVAPAASIYPQMGMQPQVTAPALPGGQLPPQSPYASLPAEQLPAAPAPAHTNAATIVLQWLTYAFWGWTVLAMSILTSITLSSFILESDTGPFTPYAIAAVLVLLPISFICDFYYAKKEPPKKTGPASIVMVIHAVLFALFGIGALITIVFCLVSMFTSSSDSQGTLVALYSSLVIMVLYGAVFLRTLRPVGLPWVRKAFLVLMLVIVGVFTVLGIVGPVSQERLRRDDRLLEGNMDGIKRSIDNYARDNQRLPATLQELDLEGDEKKIVERNLLRYTPNIKSSTTTTTDSYGRLTTSIISQSRKTYYYELCATFKKKSQYYSYGNDVYEDDDGYSTYISAYYHDEGDVCYKLKTDSY